MRVTERGQVTIPKTIREQFGFGANTEVEFVVREGRLELVPVGKSRCKKIDAIYGKKSFNKSTDELMKLLRT
jgi:AbrB family looped-hinge helix DNA binding protein